MTVLFLISCTTTKQSPSVPETIASHSSYIGPSKEIQFELDRNDALIANATTRILDILRTEKDYTACNNLPWDATVIDPEWGLDQGAGINEPRLVPGRKTCAFLFAVKNRDPQACQFLNASDALFADIDVPSELREKGMLEDYFEQYIFTIGGAAYCNARIRGFSSMDDCNAINDELFIDGVRWTDSLSLFFGSPVLRSVCIDKVLENTNNAQLCNDITETGNITVQKNHCWTTAAKIAQDIQFCKNIDDEFSYDRCIEKVAIESRKPTDCRSLKDPRFLNSCVYHVALEAGDPDLCNDFGDGDCRANVIKYGNL